MTPPAEFLRDGFGDRPYFHVLLAELTSDNTSAVPATIDPDRPSTSMPHNDRIVGHALYFYTYSTWEGKCLYLDDLFVREEYRSEYTRSHIALAAKNSIFLREQSARKIKVTTRSIQMFYRNRTLIGAIIKHTHKHVCNRVWLSGDALHTRAVLGLNGQLEGVIRPKVQCYGPPKQMCIT